MSTKLNSVVSDLYLSINTDMDVSYQTTFLENAPHCAVEPVTAEDLTNKAYVDSRLVNSGSGINLYLNYSVADAINPYKSLGTSIVITTITTIQTPQLGTQFIGSFITASGYPGTTLIPSGIYELNQFGRQVGGNVGTLKYFFTLSKINLGGTVTLLGTSGYSADINTSVTDIFFAPLSLAELTLLSTDRLVISVFSLGIGNNVGEFLDSHFQDDSYSYITTPLISGSNFLSSNNVFTGVNSFTNALTAPTILFPSATTNVANTTFVTNNFVDLTTTQTILGTKTFSKIITDLIQGSSAISTLEIGDNFTTGDINIGKNMTDATGIVKINSSIGITNIGLLQFAASGMGTQTAGATFGLCFSQIDGICNIANGSSRSALGKINIGAGAGSLGTITIGQTSCQVEITGSSVNIANTASTSIPVNIAVGAGSSGTISIGGSGRTLTFRGSTASTINIVNGLISCGNITLGTSALTQTAGTQLGGVTNGTIQSASVSSTTTIGTLTFTSLGGYIVSFGYTSNSASVLGTHYVQFTGTSLVPVPVGLYGASQADNVGLASVAATFYIKVTTIGTLNMICNLVGTITSFTNQYFTATRII